MKSKPTIGIIVIALGVLVALIPMVIFPVCSNMIELANGKALFMKCHWTAMAELLIGALIIIDGILFVVFQKRDTRMALGIMLFLLGLSSLLIPTAIIGMCEAATMACRMGTEPALIAAGVAIMAVGAGNTFIQSGFMKPEQLREERSIIK